MSEYVKTTWADGDIITAEKLNNIENGIINNSGGGGGPRLFSLVSDNQGHAQIETGLTPMDFVNAYIWDEDDEIASFMPIIYVNYTKSNDYMYVTAMAVNAPDTYYNSADIILLKYKYYPETGVLQMLRPSN